MIRITKITDHGIVLLTHFAREPANTVFNARDLAGREKMSLPMVSKILKILSGSGLLRSHRGVKGGYSLARSGSEISLAEIVAALEGPIALTDCSDDEHGSCQRESFCNVGPHWRIINRIILQSMQGITLNTLAFSPQDLDSGNHGSIPAPRESPVDEAPETSPGKRASARKKLIADT